MQINILCVGDLVGEPGRNILTTSLPGLIEKHQLELVVCNGENAAAGSGITPRIVKKLIESGVDVITLGDHAFRRKECYDLLNTSERLIRPANVSTSAAGKGWTVVESKNNAYLQKLRKG